MPNSNRGNGTWVDLDRGVVSREIFVNPDIYQEELERVFARTWLFVGHESQIPQPGDFFLSRMGEESVIVTRDPRGEVHVLLNTCRHRGMKVCRYDQGNTSVFTCPYHGWSYSTDGGLVKVPGDLYGVPQYRTGYRERLDKSEWGLVHVAQTAVYKGAVWATWDESAPPFTDYLGGMRMYLDALLDARDGSEGGSEALGGVVKWRMPCNWKFAAENFAWDTYHSPTTHKSAEIAGLGPGGEGQERHGSVHRNQAKRFTRGLMAFPGLGHATITGPPETGAEAWFPEFPNDPAVAQYFEEVQEKRKQRLEGKVTVTPGNGNVFPNTAFHPWFPRTMVVWHPVGPSRTEAWRWFLVDRDAPREVKDLLRHYYMRFSGPSGMVESDDMDNWVYATEASRGVIARRYPYNYGMGLGFARPVDGLPDAVTVDAPFSEEGARAFYKRWAELMDGKA